MGIGPKVTLTGNADNFIWVYGAMIALVALVGIYFLGRSTGSSQSKPAAVIPEAINTSQLSYSNSQYIGWASTLLQSLDTFWGAGIFADTDTVSNIMGKMKNTEDCKQLAAAFGTHRQQWHLSESNLAEWLDNCLSLSDMAKLNQILASNNVNYTF
jgi:hypothetical protein